MNAREHLLVCLAEEAAEVVQVVTKALRFGMHDSYPGYAEGLTNIQELRHELHDLIAVIEMIHDDVWDILPFDRAAIDAKKAKVLKFMQYARANGEID